MNLTLNQVEKVEIITLQDNCVDVVVQDNNEIVRRALPLEDTVIKNSILAEHGFSAIVKVQNREAYHTLLFDFGFSAFGAAFNADILDLDLTKVEAIVLSHGHPDHVGGLEQLYNRMGKRDVKLYVHPAVFRNPRYNKTIDGKKIYFPPFTRELVESAGMSIVETTKPVTFCDDMILFLGEIPKQTDFEKGVPSFCYEEDGVEKTDPIEDDTGVAIHVKGKGLVILSGCAHSGIINTIKRAQELTGINDVFAVMGGFHLTGIYFEPVIQPTIEALKTINPTYVLPTHCTGRKAIQAIEKEMPDQFLLNMSGTTLTFKA